MVAKERILALTSLASIKERFDLIRDEITAKMVYLNNRKFLTSTEDAELHIWRFNVSQRMQFDMVILLGIQAALNDENGMRTDLKDYLSNYRNGQLDPSVIKNAIGAYHRYIIDIDELLEGVHLSTPPVKEDAYNSVRKRNRFNTETGNQTLYTETLNTARVFDIINRISPTVAHVTIEGQTAKLCENNRIKIELPLVDRQPPSRWVPKLVRFFNAAEENTLGNFTIKAVSPFVGHNFFLEIKNHYVDGTRLYRVKVHRDMHYDEQALIGELAAKFDLVARKGLLSSLQFENPAMVANYLRAALKFIKHEHFDMETRKVVEIVYFKIQHLTTNEFDHVDPLTTIGLIHSNHGKLIFQDNVFKFGGVTYQK